MKMKSFLIAGFGGQGVMLIGQMLTYCAMEEGLEVTYMPSYGPEMRGGTANVTVCISSRPIASPVVSRYDVLVVMNEPSLDKFLPSLAPGGKLFVNTSVVKRDVGPIDGQVIRIDTLKIAEEVTGSGKTANMVMLGAILDKTGVLDPETMEAVFRSTMKGEKAKLIPVNVKALSAWKGSGS